MAKNKKAYSNKQLEEIIFGAIFEVADDETGNSSYRKYFDKVLKDIFGIDGIITSFMMSRNQFKAIHQMMNNPDLKPFCQMMLREEDVKILHDMVRVAYDAAQIALKPKKRVSSGDIKAYRYLTKLYTEGIKTLRKKYGQGKSEKKKYKDKYSSLSSMLGKRTNPSYNLSLMDELYEDDDPSNIFEDEDDEDDSQFDMENFDLDDLPTQFMISTDDLWKPPSKGKKLIIDSSYPELALRYVGDDEDDEEESESSQASQSDEELIMPEGQFQRYALSIFEKLLQSLEKKNEVDENSMEDKESTDMEEGNIPDPDSEVPFDDTSNPEIGVTNELVNSQPEIPVLSDTIVGTSEDSVILTPKDYQSMTREECINEFNKNSGVMPNITTTTESK